MKNKNLNELEVSSDITGSVDVPENQGTEKKKKDVIDGMIESKKLVKLIADRDIFLEKSLTLKKGDVLYVEMKLKEASEVQSILFDVNKFSVGESKAWLKDHGYKYGKVDTTDNYHRFRQLEPDQFDTMRISSKDNSEGQKALATKGIKFIFGVE